MQLFEDLVLSVPSMLITIFVSSLFAIAIKWWLNNKKYFDLASKFQEPIGFKKETLMGHAKYYTATGVLDMVKSFTASYGVAYLGPRINYYLNDADVLVDFLNNDKCLNKPYFMDYFKNFEGGLFLARDEAWRTRRKIINPTFKLKLLHSYTNTFLDYDLKMVNLLQAKIGEVFNVSELTVQCNFEKFFECALGIRDQIYSQKYYDAAMIVTEGANQRLLSIFHAYDFIFKHVKSWKNLEENVEIMRIISVYALNERREKREAEKLNEIIAEDEESKKLIFLDYILDYAENNGTLTENDIIAELNTFIFAAVDTCSTTLAFIFVLLGLYPEIQENAYNEILDILGDREFHYTDFPRFKYVLSVINETLRLFPVAPILPRVTKEDVKIGDYIFPADSNISVNIINIHYSEKYYKNPNKFDPERFNPDSEEFQKRHKYAYIPFLAGKRNCIGKNFAYLSLVSSIATICKRFRFETTYKNMEEIKLKVILTLHAVDGHLVKIFPRN